MRRRPGPHAHRPAAQIELDALPDQQRWTDDLRSRRGMAEVALQGLLVRTRARSQLYRIVFMRNELRMILEEGRGAKEVIRVHMRQHDIADRQWRDPPNRLAQRMP